MKRDSFLRTLRMGLKGLSAAEIEDIVRDYAAHFADSDASGREEADVAAALGDPSRIARELRASSGLQRFEARRNVPNMLAALMGLVGLAVFDVLVLLPLLFAMSVVTLCIVVALIAIGGFGLKMIVYALVFMGGEILSVTTGHFLIGAGLISGVAGLAALLLLALGAAVHTLGEYACLHFRLVKPTEKRLP